MDWIHGLNVLIVLSNFLTQKTGKTVTSLVTAWCWSMLANMEWVTALVASFAPSEGWRLMPAWTKSLATNVSIVASYGSGPVFAWVVPQACHWCWKWNNLFGNPTHVGLSFNMGFDMVGYTGLAYVLIIGYMKGWRVLGISGTGRQWLRVSECCIGVKQ